MVIFEKVVTTAVFVGWVSTLILFAIE